MVELFGGAAVELLRSAKWQERVEAMGGVLEAVQGMGDPGAGRCYLLVQSVAFLPGWADKNFQVGGRRELLGGGGGIEWTWQGVAGRGGQ